jgi:hypothetical protein
VSDPSGEDGINSFAVDGILSTFSYSGYGDETAEREAFEIVRYHCLLELQSLNNFAYASGTLPKKVQNAHSRLVGEGLE